MEMIMIMGAPGSGKTQYVRSKFVKSQYIVIDDNTNDFDWKIKTAIKRKLNIIVDFYLLKKYRKKYIQLAKDNGYKIKGYCITTKYSNIDTEGVEEIRIQVTEKTTKEKYIYGKQEVPKLEEGFDELHFVKQVVMEKNKHE